MKKIVLLITLVSSSFLFFGCSSATEPQTSNRFERGEFLMGTFARVRFDLQDDQGLDGEALLDEVFAIVEHFEAILTVNDDDAPSEVQEINRQAGIAPVKVSTSTFELIEEAVHYTDISDGIFNVAIGPLVKLWGINFEGARRPETAEIEAVLPLLDYNNVILDPDAQTVFLTEPGMSLDLGGIAKGFIADQIAQYLLQQGVSSALIDMGGDLFLLGANHVGNPWDVGIQDPSARRSEGSNLVGRLPITNQAVVTSGVYERFVEVDGVHYHHILNSETGFPFETGLVSITVVSDRGVDGEGYTTILFGMGLEDGRAYVENTDGIEAIFITDTDEVVLSSGLHGVFNLTNDNFTLVE